MSGTVFGAFYDVVRRIPAGSVSTYGQVARLAGCTSAGWWDMPWRPVRTQPVPCHRVVDRFGGTKAAFDTFAPAPQRALLEAEGVAFRLDGTVDLEQCLWTPES